MERQRTVGATVPPESEECCLGLIVYPSSWDISVRSCIEQLGRGRYWASDGGKNTVKDAIKTGKEIGESFMSCNLNELLHSIKEIEFTLKHMNSHISSDKLIQYFIDKPDKPEGLDEGNPGNTSITQGNLSVFETQMSMLGWETERVNITKLLEIIFTDSNSIPLPDLNPFDIKSKVNITNDHLVVIQQNIEAVRFNLDLLWRTFRSSDFQDLNPLSSESFWQLFRRSFNELGTISPWTYDKPYLLHSAWMRHSLSEIEYTLKYLYTKFHNDNPIIDSHIRNNSLPSDEDLLKYFRGGGATWPAGFDSNPSVFTKSEDGQLLTITEVIDRLSAVVAAMGGGGSAPPSVTVNVDTAPIVQQLGNIDQKLTPLSNMASLANLTNLTNLSALNNLANLAELQKLDAIVGALVAIKDCVCNPPVDNCELPVVDLSKEGIVNESTDPVHDGDLRCNVATYLYESVLDLLNNLIYWFDVISVLFDVPSALLAAALAPLLVKFTFLTRWTGEGVVLTKGATKMGFAGTAGAILFMAEIISWLASIDRLALEAFRDWWVAHKDEVICSFILRKDKGAFIDWLGGMIEIYPVEIVILAKASLLRLLSVPLALGYTIFQLNSESEVPVATESCVCTGAKVWMFREYSGDGESCRNIKFTKTNLSSYNLIFDSEGSDVAITVKDIVVNGDNWSAKMCYMRQRYKYFNAILEIRFELL